MNPRDEILGKLRTSASPRSDIARFDPDEIFSDVMHDQASALRQFEERIRSLKGECLFARGFQEASVHVGDVLGSCQPAEVLVQDSQLIEAVFRENPKLRTIWGTRRQSDEVPNASFAKMKFGITVCDALISRTGSIAISGGGRRLSVLPEAHLVIAKESQLRTTATGWLSSEYHEKTSYRVLITGPSRTADIEKILVLGAHGPKRLSVVVLLGM